MAGSSYEPMMVEDSQIEGMQMKVYEIKNIEKSTIPKEDLEKISILKLCEPGKYIKGIGIRDGRFFVLADTENDQLYLKESDDEQ
ncbi:hypothetical protein FIT67_02640 [Candidatus Methylopumilus planktonicus]|nr:hypothetical protein FIT67_02640 [Candidatus Methylopumilus planktonicus]